VTAVEFDAVVEPGGYAPDMMRRHDAMVKLVRDAARQGKVVAAICHAGWMLVTPRKPDDLPAFCREIGRALAKTT
jgi:protease I